MELQTSGNIDDELKKLDLKIKETELMHKKWELLFKLAGLLTIGFGIAWPIWQYTSGLEEKRKSDEKQAKITLFTAEREAKKPFLERQWALYTEATNAASQLATLNDGTDHEKARKRFYQLYWGELSMVEDPQVESAMVKFNEALEANHRDEMRDKAYLLAHACRDSLSKDWQELEKLVPRPTTVPSTSTTKP
jgi:hypothetical protein